MLRAHAGHVKPNEYELHLAPSSLRQATADLIVLQRTHKVAGQPNQACCTCCRLKVWAPCCSSKREPKLTS